MSSTTFRHKGGGARISVNLSPEAFKALEYLEATVAPAREVINQAILDAARDAWEAEKEQTR